MIVQRRGRAYGDMARDRLRFGFVIDRAASRVGRGRFVVVAVTARVPSPGEQGGDGQREGVDERERRSVPILHRLATIAGAGAALPRAAVGFKGHRSAKTIQHLHRTVSRRDPIGDGDRLVAELVTGAGGQR